MAGYKLSKRKGADQFSDDFSDFSLSSPATKIRRLDAELPPIAEVEVEEDELPPLPLSVTQEAPNPNPNPNEERALVLFEPLPHSPSSSSFSLSLHSDLISGVKNWSKQCDSDCDRLIRSQRQEEQDRNNNQRLALVPWVPSSSSQFPHAVHDSNSTTNTELMMEADAEEMGGEGEASMMMMDIEQEDPTTNTDDSSTSTIHPINPTSTPPLNLHHHGMGMGMGIGVGGGMTTTAPEGFHQWQQQHCLLPHFPQNTSTPITWTR